MYTYAVLFVFVINHRHGTSIIAIMLQARAIEIVPVTKGLSLVRSTNRQVNQQSSSCLGRAVKGGLTNLSVKINIAYITQHTGS